MNQHIKGEENTLPSDVIKVHPSLLTMRGEPRTPLQGRTESNSNRHVVVVEDDVDIRDWISVSLRQQGFRVSTVESDAELRHLMEEDKVDLILLDLLLQQDDGLLICQRLRQYGYQTPVIMVSGLREDNDRIVGLEVGADDYVSKPFVMRELLARIKARLRQKPLGFEVPPPPQENLVVEFGDVEFDVRTRRLTRAGKSINLTSSIYVLLCALVCYPRQTLTRHKLARICLGREYKDAERSLDILVSRLRRLVEANPNRPRFIQTVWGVGYVFIPDNTKPPINASLALAHIQMIRKSM